MAKFSSLFLFADDSKCSKKVDSSNDCILLQEDLDRFYQWSLHSQLSFNLGKSSQLSFCSVRHTPMVFSYSINGQPLPRNSSVKDLGILFTSNLSWSEHIKSIVSKGYQTLGLLRRAFPSTTPVRAKKLLFLSLVLPKLSYCSPIWRPNLVKDITVLEGVQRRATKFILNDYSSDYKSRLQSLHLLPLMYRLELNDIMFFVSSVKNPSPHFNILNYFTFCHHSISTRSATKSKLQLSFSSSSLVHHSFFHRLPRLWNSLPEIDLSRSIVSIKQFVTERLIDHFNDHFNPDDPCTYHFLCPCYRCSHFPTSSSLSRWFSFFNQVRVQIPVICIPSGQTSPLLPFSFRFFFFPVFWSVKFK